MFQNEETRITFKLFYVMGYQSEVIRHRFYFCLIRIFNNFFDSYIHFLKIFHWKQQFHLFFNIKVDIAKLWLQWFQELFSSLVVSSFEFKDFRFGSMKNVWNGLMQRIELFFGCFRCHFISKIEFLDELLFFFKKIFNINDIFGFYDFLISLKKQELFKGLGVLFQR